MAPLLGVDLGTSHTVAVLRGPNGRTRPLLFDGQPVMPSAVCLGEDGQLQVGRDAVRLALLDPARFEPNPKRLIDDQTALLGDRTVSVIQMLGAVLKSVAAAAKEASGEVPPVVLTYPASWGNHRRQTLTQAARLAGFTSPRFVPEPIAAARYFTDVLGRPVPVGRALAVFDFGGGTLDVAVVTNDGGAWHVLGVGGSAELGGLDVDALLVEHLGALINKRNPEVWQRLQQPTTAAQRRDRRLFWEDVRGAKEMLSRTTVAPVHIPGLDDAVHLTRDELERLAGPLLNRAVAETEQTIAAAGLAPKDLAGLFLVGGASRIPLVARLLHTRLGIAPTVLEQPELPVGEGALYALEGPPKAELAAVAPMSDATKGELEQIADQKSRPNSPLRTSTRAGGGAPEAGPPIPGSAQRQPPLWMAAAAVVALVVILSVAIGYAVLGRYPERPFSKLQSVGSVKITDGALVDVATVGDIAWFAASRGRQLVLAPVNLRTGKAFAQVAIGDAEDFGYIQASTTSVAIWAKDATGNRPFYVYDTRTGQTWTRAAGPEDWGYFVGENFVFVDRRQQLVRGLDAATGRQQWQLEDMAQSTIVPADVWRDHLGGADFEGRPYQQAVGGDQRLVLVRRSGEAQVIDSRDGAVLSSRPNVVDSGARTLVYRGALYVLQGDSVGRDYTISRYDLDNLSGATRTYRATDSKREHKWLGVCGEEMICALDAGDQESQTDLITVDADSLAGRWRRSVPNAKNVAAVGAWVMVNYAEGASTEKTEMVGVWDADGGRKIHVSGRIGARVDSASALLVQPSQVTNTATTPRLTGLGLVSGDQKDLGPVTAVLGHCTWTETHLACPTGGGQFEIWKFRD